MNPCDDVEEALELLRYKKNLVLQGPPQVGKTFFAKRLALFCFSARGTPSASSMQFHQSYSYEDFVQGYRPSDDANPVELDYVCDPRTGLAFPGIWLVLRHPEENRELEVQCHLDSGAGVSLFDGQMGKAIGLERERGRPIVFSATTGAEVVARLHRVRIEHTQLGERQVEIVQ